MPSGHLANSTTLTDVTGSHPARRPAEPSRAHVALRRRPRGGGGLAAADASLWKARSRPRHYAHSKMMAWVALDRAIDLLSERPGWVGAGDAARTALVEGTQDGHLPRVLPFGSDPGGEGMDAALLLAPLHGVPLPVDVLDATVRGRSVRRARRTGSRGSSRPSPEATGPSACAPRKPACCGSPRLGLRQRFSAKPTYPAPAQHQSAPREIPLSLFAEGSSPPTAVESSPAAARPATISTCCRSDPATLGSCGAIPPPERD